MKEHHRIALERGLNEFDRAVDRRRSRRRAVTVGAMGLVVVVVATVAMRLNSTTTPPIQPKIIAIRALPSYVEIITDDAQLTVELELANACERIGRNAGRIYVMECTRLSPNQLSPIR